MTSSAESLHARWVLAQRIAFRDPTAQVPVGPRVAVAGVVAAVTVAVVAATAAYDDDDPVARPLWRDILGVAFAAVGLILAIVLLVRSTRRGRTDPWWWSPLWALTRSQRRAVRRVVLGHRPPQPEELVVARYVARRTVQQRDRGWFLASLVPLVVSAVLINGLRPASLLYLSGVALSVIGVLVSVRDAPRAAEFLRRYPEPTPVQ